MFKEIVKSIAAIKTENDRDECYWQIDRKTNQVIHEYPSIAAASRATGLDDSAIGKVCKGKLPHAGGFLFRYIEQ